MKQFRKAIFWIHLVSGITVGLVILIMSLTGALLAFQPPLLRFAEREFLNIQPPIAGSARLEPQALFSKLKEVRPELTPTALTLEAEPTPSAMFLFGRDGVLYANPYTGAPLGAGATKLRACFRFIEDWHRWLGVGTDNRPIGRAITGVSNAAFLLLAITGVCLWWPKRVAWRNLKPIIFFRPGLSGRARNFNWHNVTGFWSSTILILLTATGLVMSYQWANNLLYTLTGSEPPVQQGPSGASPAAPARASAGRDKMAAGDQGALSSAKNDAKGPPEQGGRTGRNPGEPGRPESTANPVPANLDHLWALAVQKVPDWRLINLRLGNNAGAPVTFSIRDGKYWNPIASSQLLVDPSGEKVLRWEPYAELNTGRRLRSWVRSIHTGEAGRLPGQIIAFLACLGGLFLVWTGFALALRRFRSWISAFRGINARVEVESAEGELNPTP